MTRILDFSAPLGQKAGRGHWNDLDMLEIGNGGMTFDEYGEWFGSNSQYCTQFTERPQSDPLLVLEYPQESPHSR